MDQSSGLDCCVVIVNNTTFAMLTYLTYLSNLSFILGDIISCAEDTSFS